MKYIKKFNESINIDETKDIINDIFIDFMDNNSIFLDYDKEANEFLISLDIDSIFETIDEASSSSESSSITIESNSINRFIDYHTKMLNFYNKLEECLDRLRNFIDIKEYYISYNDGELLNGKILSYINISVLI